MEYGGARDVVVSVRARAGAGRPGGDAGGGGPGAAVRVGGCLAEPGAGAVRRDAGGSGLRRPAWLVAAGDDGAVRPSRRGDGRATASVSEEHGPVADPAEGVHAGLGGGAAPGRAGRVSPVRGEGARGPYASGRE